MNLEAQKSYLILPICSAEVPKSMSPPKIAILLPNTKSLSGDRSLKDANLWKSVSIAMITQTHWCPHIACAACSKHLPDECRCHSTTTQRLRRAFADSAAGQMTGRLRCSMAPIGSPPSLTSARQSCSMFYWCFRVLGGTEFCCERSDRNVSQSCLNYENGFREVFS